MDAAVGADVDKKKPQIGSNQVQTENMNKVQSQVSTSVGSVLSNEENDGGILQKGNSGWGSIEIDLLDDEKAGSELVTITVTSGKDDSNEQPEVPIPLKPSTSTKTKSKNGIRKNSSSNKLKPVSSPPTDEVPAPESPSAVQDPSPTALITDKSVEATSALSSELSTLRSKLNETKQLLIQKETSHKEKLLSLEEDLNLEKNRLLEEQKNALEIQKNEEIAALKREFETKLLSADSRSKNSNESDSEILLALQTALSERDSQINQLNNSIAVKTNENQKTISDLTKVKEALADRERALETAAKNLADLHRQQQELSTKVADLQSEIAEKDARLRQQQSLNAEEAELRKQLQKAQEYMKEQNERLAAFEHEGQTLAKKQGEMEKLVRKGKTDLKEKETEITKLKESKEQLMKAMQELQDLLKKHENDANNSAKSLSAMQAVSQASAEKLAKLEADINSKSDELASQRRALENAWSENNELKRAIADLKADRDDLRRQLGEGTSRVMETESSRRDIEQREAVLRATSKQLQESLQRQMQEAAAREERLRDEIIEMRQRWQEAVSSRENLAAELGNASTPLVRESDHDSLFCGSYCEYF